MTAVSEQGQRSGEAAPHKLLHYRHNRNREEVDMKQETKEGPQPSSPHVSGNFKLWRQAMLCLLLTATLVTLGNGQATPVNFRQNGAAQDLGGGNLRFFYLWDSSTGNLANLGDCQVGEHVAYPGANDPYVWTSPPYQANFGTPNPTVIWLRATTGRAQDTHSHAGFLRPYRADNFTATQDYRWRCTNVNNDAITNFANFNGIQIVRTVTNPRGNCWAYTITKSGAQAQLIPLPGSGPCGNNMRAPVTAPTQPGGQGAGFQLANTTVSLHEPVMASFSVYNWLGEPASFDLGLNGTANFEVAVTGPDGKTTTSQLRSEGFGEAGGITLGAGEQFSTNLLLNQWNAFGMVGNYRVTITLLGAITGSSGRVMTAQPSQTLYLYVAPRDPQKLAQIAASLAEIAIHAPAVGDRMDAALELSYIDDAVAVPQLLRVLQQGEFVEHYAIEGLGRVGNASAIAGLWGASLSPDPDIRALAIFTLNQIGQPSATITD
jgi:hypothetical protein